MGDWIEIGRLGDIVPRGARCLRIAGLNLAVFRTADDRVFALENRCAHKGGPLSEGIVHGTSVTCPLHNWIYDLETGRAQGADEGQVRSFATRLVDGRILIAAPLPAQAADMP